MATLLSDVFTDTDGVDLNAHTPGTNIPASTYSLERMLTGWAAPTANSVEIQSNQLDIDVSGDGFVYDCKVTDYTVDFDWIISVTTGHRVGVYIRRTDLDNLYYWNLREPNDDWFLYRMTAGVQTQIATGAYTFNTSTTYAIKVVVSGTTSQLWINGVQQGATQTIDQHTTATKMGIGTQTIATPNRLDNLVITNTPTVTMIDFVPGSVATFTLTGFPIAPTGALVNGITEAITGGATTTAGSVVAIPETDFIYGGHHAVTRYNTNVTARVSIGAFYAEDTVQVVPASAAQLAARSAAALANPIDSYAGGSVATNDDVYQYSSPASAFTPSPPTNAYTALISSFTLYTKFYDVSASSWSGLTTLIVGNREGITMRTVINVVKRLRRVI